MNEMWEKEDILRLVDLYEKEPCLYASSHPDYRNRLKRKEAMERLTKAISVVRPGTNLRDVRDKLENLRTIYIFYRKKVLESIENGDESIYEPTLWNYDRMRFLDDHILKNKYIDASKKIRLRSENNDITSPTIEEPIFHDTELEEILSSIEMHYDQESQLIPEICTDLTQNINDEYTLFGKYLAQRLRRMENEESIKVQNDIIMMLMEAEKTDKTAL